MPRRTLRTLYRWLPAVLLIGLPLPVVAAELPAEFRTLLNQLEFVGQFATWCDIKLTFRGLPGLDEHDCRVFWRLAPKAIGRLPATKQKKVRAAVHDQTETSAEQPSLGKRKPPQLRTVHLSDTP
jgi:hypothetical protein